MWITTSEAFAIGNCKLIVLQAISVDICWGDRNSNTCSSVPVTLYLSCLSRSKRVKLWQQMQMSMPRAIAVVWLANVRRHRHAIQVKPQSRAPDIHHKVDTLIYIHNIERVKSASWRQSRWRSRKKAIGLSPSPEASWIYNAAAIVAKISGFITGEGSKTCFKACTLLLVSTLVFHDHVLRSICPLQYRPATWFRPSRVVKLWSSTTMCNTICSLRKPCSFICDVH